MGLYDRLPETFREHPSGWAAVGAAGSFAAGYAMLTDLVDRIDLVQEHTGLSEQLSAQLGRLATAQDIEAMPAVAQRFLDTAPVVTGPLGRYTTAGNAWNLKATDSASVSAVVGASDRYLAHQSAIISRESSVLPSFVTGMILFGAAAFVFWYRGIRGRGGRS